jgi:hypothetical protein
VDAKIIYDNYSLGLGVVRFPSDLVATVQVTGQTLQGDRILALLEQRQRHGYEIGQLIADRSEGAISFHVASLYPTLYRLEDKRLIDGRWVEKAGQRRRRQ